MLAPHLGQHGEQEDPIGDLDPESFTVSEIRRMGCSTTSSAPASAGAAAAATARLLARLQNDYVLYFLVA